MKEPVFKGFTPQTFRFLRDLEVNNNKVWFDAHKPIYESELLNPLKALFLALFPVMYAIDSGFDPRPHRCISRIYRDTRFSKDKQPYKTFMWMAFQHPVSSEEWKDYPGYFIELAGTSYTLGLGLFQPKKRVMDNFRDAVAYDAGEFQRVTTESVLNNGYTIKGEAYKRPVANELPAYFQPWIQRKGIWVDKTMPVGDELYSEAFASLVANDFKAMEWLYHFLKAATDL